MIVVALRDPVACLSILQPSRPREHPQLRKQVCRRGGRCVDLLHLLHIHVTLENRCLISAQTCPLNLANDSAQSHSTPPAVCICQGDVPDETRHRSAMVPRREQS